MEVESVGHLCCAGVIIAFVLRLCRCRENAKVDNIFGMPTKSATTGSTMTTQPKCKEYDMVAPRHIRCMFPLATLVGPFGRREQSIKATWGFEKPSGAPYSSFADGIFESRPCQKTCPVQGFASLLTQQQWQHVGW